MTSYMYPPAMPVQDFFSTPLYDDQPSGSAYTSYLDTAPVSAPMTTMEFAALQAPFFPQPTFQDARYTMDSTQPTRAFADPYSPPRSPPAQALDMTAPQLSTSSDSSASIQSTTSSAVPSPALPATFDSWGYAGLGLSQAEAFPVSQAFATSSLETGAIVAAKDPGCVDPSLINNPYASPNPYPTSFNSGSPSPRITFYEHPPSPALSHVSNQSLIAAESRKIKHGSQSPRFRFEPYPSFNESRRPSLGSQVSRVSRSSRSDPEDESQKGLCPIPECGRVFKDLKAHMLTHQNERPEKCPIQTCEYHVKGFARKYDKNRHTLTHYKGTMVCGFCPGSGSAAEKSFNRADVFKRHLTSVHGVEQTPPNSRKKSPSSKKGSNAQTSSSGTCSTCGVVFANAQEFYEHLDDCVLRVVQQIEPSEAINQKNLESVQNDDKVKKTLERHHLPTNIDFTLPSYEDDDEEDDDAENEDSHDGSSDPRSGKGSIKSRKQDSASHFGGGNSNRITKNGGRGAGNAGPRAGLTHSKGGVPFTGLTSGRKKRKNYPSSWGCPADRMNMKKRVMCVYDGPRRLWKDDMMLDREFEVRVNLPDGKSYVTDLDIQTMKRAEALHGATEEERGPWVPDNVLEVETEQFLM